jgi:hypothetical protein
VKRFNRTFPCYISENDGRKLSMFKGETLTDLTWIFAAKIFRDIKINIQRLIMEFG